MNNFSNYGESQIGTILSQTPRDHSEQLKNLENFRAYLELRVATKRQSSKTHSLSFKFSKIDYEKQCRTIQELKAMNPNRRNYGDPAQSEIDF